MSSKKERIMFMLALVTGASSGFGRDMARALAKRGVSLILTARRVEPMEELKSELESKYNISADILPFDLGVRENCFKLYEAVKNKDVDIVINNAGFGVFGAFDETDIEKELGLIDLNITAVHILTKLFASDFKKRNSGYILNVASIAAYGIGPLFSSYYASKSYVHKLTLSIAEELRRTAPNVYMGVLCPGPAATNFDKVANVAFSIGMQTSEFVANYAIKKMFEKKKVIVPGFGIKCMRIMSKIAPEGITARVCYKMQHKKLGKKS